jgi:hypothetical protein
VRVLYRALGGAKGTALPAGDRGDRGARRRDSTHKNKILGGPQAARGRGACVAVHSEGRPLPLPLPLPPKGANPPRKHREETRNGGRTEVVCAEARTGTVGMPLGNSIVEGAAALPAAAPMAYTTSPQTHGVKCGGRWGLKSGSTFAALLRRLARFEPSGAQRRAFPPPRAPKPHRGPAGLYRTAMLRQCVQGVGAGLPHAPPGGGLPATVGACTCGWCYVRHAARPHVFVWRAWRTLRVLAGFAAAMRLFPLFSLTLAVCFTLTDKSHGSSGPSPLPEPGVFSSSLPPRWCCPAHAGCTWEPAGECAPSPPPASPRASG